MPTETPADTRRLTEKERAAVLKAADTIADGRENWSCTALERYGGRSLKEKYVDFYGQQVCPITQKWITSDDCLRWAGTFGNKNARELRTMLLVNFAEACS